MALSGALLLEHLGHAAEARLVEQAVMDQVQHGAHTQDLTTALGGSAASTQQVGVELLARLERLAAP
jgi:isocitrate/isopropylmalate dehydrogenase